MSATMSAAMSAAMTVPYAYYQSFDSQSRMLAAETAPPDESEIVARADQRLLEQARQQTYELHFLTEGWNGYNALPPSTATVDHAMRWLDSSYRACKDAGVRWYRPNVTASAEGEVVFEWWASDRCLLIYVEADSATFHQALEGDGPTQHTHGDAPLGESQTKLLRWFGE